MLPFYELTINENDDTGVDFNAFVLRPAHGKPYMAFNKDTLTPKYIFNEEKRMVMGVMISANTPIYRSEPDRYVLFKPQTISLIRKKNLKNGFANNVNIEHDSNRKIKGVRMVSDFIVSHVAHIPYNFRGLNIQLGTWFRCYKIENPQIWKQIKSGDFSGFSVEGYFDQIEINLKTNKK